MTLRLANARIVLADRILEGGLEAAGGLVTGFGPDIAGGEDLGGDLLLPGLVELHTDQFENHYRPRPGVFWDPLSALHAHDVQIAGSGITTVYDAVRIGSDPDLPDMAEHVERLVGAIARADAEGRLRAEHFVHLRCELPTENVVAQFEAWAGHPLVRLASLMDHTPGQRQFRSIEAFKAWYRSGRTPEELDHFIADRIAEHERYAAPNRRRLVERARDIGLALASHDDATPAQVAESAADGMRIAEFPTTLASAEAAREAGLAVLMGAPNVVRGGSHSGNVSARDLLRAGCLDILSSDYVPFSMLEAVFVLVTREGFGLPDAMRLVSANPARAAGLEDRGEIAAGLRADLVRVSLIDERPVVRAVWRQGRRIA